MNSMAKGGRTFRKLMAYALTFPGVQVVPIYQVSRFAQPQPFDAIVFRNGYMIRIVEARTNQWGVSKTSTRQLSQLPGEYYHKQIWMLKDRWPAPLIREWNGEDWVSKSNPWESE